MVALLYFGNVAAVACADNGKCVDVECADTYNSDDEGGVVLIDCDGKSFDNNVTDEVDCSHTSRVCGTRPPVRLTQVKNHSGRKFGESICGVCGHDSLVRRQMLMCYRSASVSFPLCASASERIVALRHIIR